MIFYPLRPHYFHSSFFNNYIIFYCPGWFYTLLPRLVLSRHYKVRFNSDITLLSRLALSRNYKVRFKSDITVLSRLVLSRHYKVRFESGITLLSRLFIFLFWFIFKLMLLCSSTQREIFFFKPNDVATWDKNGQCTK